MFWWRCGSELVGSWRKLVEEKEWEQPKFLLIVVWPTHVEDEVVNRLAKGKLALNIQVTRSILGCILDNYN